MNIKVTMDEKGVEELVGAVFDEVSPVDVHYARAAFAGCADIRSTLGYLLLVCF